MSLIRSVLLLPVALSCALFATPAQGDLKFDRKEFIHEAEPGEDAFKATFGYENTSDQPVVIREIKTFCGCLSASVDKPIVKPGEKGVLTGVFSIGKITGKVTKQIEVTTSLTKDPVKRLDVSVNIPELVRITPADGLKWLVGEAATAKTLKIEILAKDPIQVTSVESSRQNVAHGLKTIREGREYEIIVQPLSTSEVTLGFLKITTDCKFEKHRNQMAFFTIMKKVGSR